MVQCMEKCTFLFWMLSVVSVIETHSKLLQKSENQCFILF